MTKEEFVSRLTLADVEVIFARLASTLRGKNPKIFLSIFDNPISGIDRDTLIRWYNDTIDTLSLIYEEDKLRLINLWARDQNAEINRSLLRYIWASKGDYVETQGDSHRPIVYADIIVVYAGVIAKLLAEDLEEFYKLTQLNPVESILKQGIDAYFTVVKDHLVYVSTVKNREFGYIVSRAKESVNSVLDRSDGRSDMYVDLVIFAKQYRDRLEKISEPGGCLYWQAMALRLERYIAIYRHNSRKDPVEFPSFDPALDAVIDELIVANGLLGMALPDVRKGLQDLEVYNRDKLSVKTALEDYVTPSLRVMSESLILFDQNTRKIASDLSNIGSNSGIVPNEIQNREDAAKTSFTRGGLAAITRILLPFLRERAKATTDHAVAGFTLEFVKEHWGKLAAGAIWFLRSVSTLLSGLASSWPSAFGWISSLLRLLGLS
jgi:hypothetical protein